jgi:hypothetical protein
MLESARLDAFVAPCRPSSKPAAATGMNAGSPASRHIAGDIKVFTKSQMAGIIVSSGS